MNIEHSESPDPIDQAASNEPEAAAPKRKPRARKAAEADASLAAPMSAEAGATEAPAAEEAAKPARAPRKPRAPKAAAETEAAGEAASAPVPAESTPSAPPEVAAESAPRPARRGRGAARSEAAGQGAPADPAGDAAISSAPAAEAAGREPAHQGAPARRTDEAVPYSPPAADDGFQAGGEDRDVGDDGQDGEHGSQAGREPGGEAGGEAPGEATGEGRRERSRNRRRGRRGNAAHRGDGAEGGEGSAGLPALPPDAVLAQPDSIMPMLDAPDTSEVFNLLLSGDFDAEQPDELPEPSDADDKRVLAPDPDAPKLHKVLAQSGIGSRRDMEQMIQEGRVSVNGETAHIGMRISFGDRIAIDGKPAKVRISPPPPRIIAYHKPVGEVVTHDDPQQRPTVFRRLPRLQQGKWQSVGRLDINTEGLLLFTNSGDLANKLMHPRFGVEREYAVRVLGTLEKEAKQQLLDGVTIEGQPAAFKSIEDGGGEGVNHWYRVVITEGRNREVRKLFDAVGLTVSRLIRVRYGCVVLPRGLKRGVWVDLSEGDVKALRQLAGGPQPQHAGQHPSQQRHDTRGGEPRRDGGKPQRPPQPQPQARRGNEPRQNAPDRNKPPREDRERRPPRGPNPASQGGDVLPRDLREPGDPTRIPNPLQQTFDKRAMQRERHVAVRDELYEDGPIPNPLEQTYDKRFVQGQRGGGFGNPNQPRGGKGAPRGNAPGGQPDPLKTAVGYIGADAFTRKSQGGGRGGPRGGRRGGR